MSKVCEENLAKAQAESRNCSQKCQLRTVELIDGPDVFLWLKKDTVPEIRAVFNWELKRALLSEISFLDDNGFQRKRTTDINMDELLEHIRQETKQFFRIIVRKNFNWFLLLSSEKHIEDLIEIGIR